MAKVVGLPKLSPTMDEGTLVKWTKGEGDVIAVDDLLAEVETDKATMEFRSFDKGTLLKILVPEGETLAPDTPVAIIGEKGEDISALLSQAAQGGGGSASASAPENQQSKAAPAQNAAISANGQAKAGASEVLASPVVRKVAREKGINLNDVSGSGPGGRIVKRDVDALLDQGSSVVASAASSQAVAPTGRPAPRIEKLSSMRRTIARRLTESKQQVPHFYLTVDIDAAPLMKLRKSINQKLEKDGVRVSLNDLVIKGAASALYRVPEVNASFMGDSIHYHNRVDISVAVAIPDGLVTPVVRDADRKGVREISLDVKSLAKRARVKKLLPEEMSDGTFSVSNLGMFGIEDFGAVINPPEGAILAVGGVRELPVVSSGQVVPGQRMKMTLSCDHRVVDGALAAQWLATLRQMLEDPTMMLV